MPSLTQYATDNIRRMGLVHGSSYDPAVAAAAGENLTDAQRDEVMLERTTRGNLQDRAGNVTDYQDHIFETYYKPLEDRLLADANSMDIVNSARKSGSVAGYMKSAHEQRMLSRIGNPETANQRKERLRLGGLSSHLNLANSVNTAKVAQQDRNQAARQQLVGLGQGIQNTASGIYIDQAGREQDRMQAYQTAKANEKMSRNNFNTDLGVGLMGMMGNMI